MRTTNWTPTLAWLAAVTGAVVLAVAAPSETNLMGRLPSLTAERLGQQRMAQPSGAPAARTLALVGFSRNQRSEIHSWIKGLGLDQDTDIDWIKMPVLNDPGNDDARQDVERRILAGHSLSGLQTRIVPMFTNRDEFIRAAGLSGMEHASVLVLNRDGKVLARAEGPYNEAKAAALRETLMAKHD